VEFDDIRAFVAIIDTGSVSGAGRQLFLTQPAVTRRLQRLEHTLGTALVDRERRPLVATPAGHDILEKCRRILRSARDIKTAVNGNGSPAGELRIGVAHALTEIALTKPLDRLRKRFPRVDVLLTTGWSRALLEQVRLGSLDAAVILLPEDETLPGGVLGTELGKEQLVVVAPKGTGRPKRTLADLKRVNWILNPEGCGARASLRRALQRANVELRVVLETYNYPLQLNLVARKRGWSLVPARILHRSPLRRRLRTLPVEGLRFPLNVWTVTTDDQSSLSSVIEELSRQLKDRLASRRPL